jgi:dTDP-4-amino-4,6-dideoxygalactose transaminase
MSGFQEWLLRRLLAEASPEAHRRLLKEVYDSALAAAGLPVLKVPRYADPILLRYPVRVRNKDRVLAEARRRWIELGDWYKHPVDRPEGSVAADFGYRTGMCPEGERASREVVTLPMHTRVTEAIARKSVNFLKELA